ncbi:prealbumin-like fold domain-containing protein [Lachnospiraceae bacterium 38-10]
MRRKTGKRIGCFILCMVLVLGGISVDLRAAAVSGNDPQETEISEIEPEEETEEQTEEEAAAISGNDPQEGVPTEQYHFVEEDRRTVEKWLETYCADGFEELLTYDERWWNSLYDYEREYAEFLLGLIVEIPGDVYDEQELSECIRILESGVKAEDFFRGTIFQGLTLEDLKKLQETGGILEEVQERQGETAAGRRKVASRAMQDGERVARVQVTPTGYSGRGHGTIYRITLGGVPALCISFGKSCRNSFLYHAEPGTYQKKVGHMAYFASHASVTGATYVACQIAAWIFMEDENLNETNVKSRAQAMLNISSEESMEKMLTYVWSFYSSARTYSAAYYEYRSDNPAAQILIVYKEATSDIYTAPVKPVEPEIPEIPDVPDIETITGSARASYTVEVRKSDWQTGVGLAGCEVELFENGEYLTTVTTDENGRAEYSVERSAEFSAVYDGVTVTKEEAEASLRDQEEAFQKTSYTYSSAEVTAPRGYVWEANEKSADAAGDERALLELTNERTLGAVELIKYDMESESAGTQGDATLDGAKYGIYAAEDIRHQDEKTGVLYRKDELVQTAVVGKTPGRDKDGYLLNTDGSRHIANPGGEIAYKDTPGKTLFGDLELGSYYIREIEASEGYMLDEAAYPVTFTYKWQMVKVENRNETAGEADNGLTVDDNSSSKAVCSGDYAIKQGIQFVKTSDNTYQTELKPIQGAGFSVYLISELSGVKDGSIASVGENWTADDVMTFYDYDFTGEKRASLYKRTGHEEWTEGDRLWLEAGEKPNEYYVKEMFTDGDGRVITPELPFGTYVIAETTTPEHHACAKPFIVYVTGDGGVLYTDGTKQKIEKSYTVQEGIRYGDHKNTREREGRILQKQRIINNRITKAYLRVLKTDEEFTIVPGAYVEAGEFGRGTVLKEGAEYRLKCITLPLSRESLIALNWKFDGDGYMSYYDPGAKTLTGTAERPFRTGFLKKDGKIQDCYITLPQEVPIGTYELEEVTAPEGYVLNGKEQFVLDDSSEGVNRYEIVDTPFPRVIFTINNGAVYPDGQMGTNKYALTDEYGNLTVTVLQENQEQKGIVEITKHGEKLSGVHEDEETLSDKLRGEPFREIGRAEESAHRDMVFEYEDAPVENACFEIIAAEDIYSQELQRDLLEQYRADKKEYLIHKKGDVAAAITTDKNGWGYAPDLYIGKYRIRETIAGEGFVLNREEKEFEITGHEQNVNFDFYAADYRNERQKLEISVKKRDEETGEPLAGAVYGLYAKEDIGEFCPADTLIATCVTGEDGRGVFGEDLPLGEYYVRELEAPRGYLTSPLDLSVNGSYDSAKGGQETEKQEHCVVFENKKTRIFVTKQDLTDGREITGATLEIKEIETDGEGGLKKDDAGNYLTKTVAFWVSGEEEKEGHLIEGLQIGRACLLSERIAPDGYGYAEDILFKLQQEREEEALTDRIGLYVMEEGEWRRAAEDTLRMYDEREALKIEKSTIRMTQHGDVYGYRVDELRNLTGESLEQFTVTDHLPESVCLTELWTGTYKESLFYDAEYMTNKSADWVSWESGLSTEENHHLIVPENLRTAEEHVTKFRLCFGTVGGDFGKIKPLTYMTYVSQEAQGVLLNEIELTAQRNGKKWRDKDRTETILYRNGLSGYESEGGGSPLYEVVDVPQDTAEGDASILQRAMNEAGRTGTGGLERLEDEGVPMGRYGKGGGIRTGDDAPFMLLTCLALTTGAGIIICLRRKRKKEYR